jgi:hypothetical protein
MFFRICNKVFKELFSSFPFLVRFRMSFFAVRFISGFLFAAFTIVMALPVCAQNVLRSETKLTELPVDDRVPGDMQVPGLTYKGFVIKPQTEVSALYDSNIFAESNNETSDFIASVKPSVHVLGKYRNHRFLAGADLNIERFFDEDDEDKEEYKVFFRGNFGSNRRWRIPFNLSYRHLARNRSAPRNLDLSAEPVYIDGFRAGAGLSRQFGTLNITLTGNYGDITNENGVSRNTANPVIYSDNDRNIYSATLKLRHKIPRGNNEAHILYADYGIEKQDYNRRDHNGTGFLGISRNNINHSFLAGFETDYKGLIFANIGAGYFWRKYDDPLLENTESYDFTADVAWNIFPKLTLSFSADREAEQNNDFLQGYVRTNYIAGLDYEFLHNLYLDSSIGYKDYDFSDNSGAGREEEDYLVNLGLRYLHSRYLESGLEFKHQRRSANISANEFKRTIFMLRMRGRL